MPSDILPHHIKDTQVDQPKKIWENTWLWIILVTSILFVSGTIALTVCLTRPGGTDNPEPNTEPPVSTTQDPTSTQKAPTIEICTTSSCQDDAAKLIKAMNTSVDPCQDFFQYVCGGFIAENPGMGVDDITRQKISSSILNILKAENDPNDPIPVNQARDFYAACKNSELREQSGIRPLIDLLKIYGSWPMTVESWEANNFNWEKITADMRVLYNTNIFVTVNNDLSPHDGSKNAVLIDQPSLIRSRDEILQQTKIAEYTALITGAAMEIRNALKSPVTNSQLSNDIADMIGFESALALITTPTDSPLRRKLSWMKKPMTMNELQAWTDRVTTSTSYAKINWFDFINRIYNHGAGIDIPTSERMFVSETSYLQNLIGLLDKTPLRTIANYVHWNLVYRLVGTTNKRMADLKYEFNWIPTDLDQSCANEANELLGFAISQKYVESNFDGKNEVMAMVSNSKAALKSLITEAHWMDSYSKAKLKDKVDDMVANIGYPDWIMSKASLESYYSTLSISRANYF